VEAMKIRTGRRSRECPADRPPETDPGPVPHRRSGWAVAVRRSAETWSTTVCARRSSQKGWISIHPGGMFRYCREEPLVNVAIPGKPLVILHRVTVDDVDSIVRAVKNGEVPAELALCPDPDMGPADHRTAAGLRGWVPRHSDLRRRPFFRSSEYKVESLRAAGLIDPGDIEEYIAVGGYSAALSALTTMEPEAIIDVVEKSGLRWSWAVPASRRAESGGFTRLRRRPRRSTFICNADEGDPGAYMKPERDGERSPHADRGDDPRRLTPSAG